MSDLATNVPYYGDIPDSVRHYLPSDTDPNVVEWAPSTMAQHVDAFNPRIPALG